MDSSGVFPSGGVTTPAYRTPMGAMLDTSRDRERHRQLLGVALPADGALFQPQPPPAAGATPSGPLEPSGIVSVVKFARPVELGAMHLNESSYQNLRPSYSHLPTYQLPASLLLRSSLSVPPTAAPDSSASSPVALADGGGAALRTPDSNLCVSSLGSDLMTVSQVGLQQPSARATDSSPPLVLVEPPPTYSDAIGGCLLDGAESSHTAGEHSSEVRECAFNAETSKTLMHYA